MKKSELRTEIIHLKHELCLQSQAASKANTRLVKAEERILTLELALSTLRKAREIPSPQFPRVVVQHPLIQTVPFEGKLYNGPVRVYTSPESAAAGEGINLGEEGWDSASLLVSDL